MGAVRVLLDTHILLWARTDDPRLSRRARGILASETAELHLSVVSLWEIVLKVQANKLRLPVPPEVFAAQCIEAFRLRVLNVELEHVTRLAGLPAHHKDPFDRMLMAQSLAEGLPLLTGDAAMSRYGVETVW